MKRVSILSISLMAVAVVVLGLGVPWLPGQTERVLSDEELQGFAGGAYGDTGKCTLIVGCDQQSSCPSNSPSCQTPEDADNNNQCEQVWQWAMRATTCDEITGTPPYDCEFITQARSFKCTRTKDCYCKDQAGGGVACEAVGLWAYQSAMGNPDKGYPALPRCDYQVACP